MHAASIIAGRRTAWVFALLPIVFAVAVIGGIGEAGHEADARDQLPDHADSTAAAGSVDDLPQESTEAAIVLWTADAGKLRLRGPRPDRGRGQGARRGRPGAVRGRHGGDRRRPARGRQRRHRRGAVDDLREQAAADAPDGVTAQVTGPAGVHADLGAVFDGADMRLLLATMLIVAVLLVITYRSPVLWIIPLVVVGLADRSPPSPRPRPSTRPDCPGTAPPPASSRCSSSAPAPTTRCC